MNDTRTKRKSRVPKIVIGLGFTFAGLLWLGFILFFAGDSIGDYREAHSSEVGAVPPWSWHDTLQHLGGITGLLTGFAPPVILLGYGIYVLCFTLTQTAEGLGP